MKRLAAGLCAGVSALAAFALAGPAAAAISPKLAVTPTNAKGANLLISGGVSNPGEDAFAKVQIFVPAGWALRAPAGGANVGTVTAHALSRDIDPTQETNWSGDIVAVGLADPALAWEQANCDSSTHAAAWIVRLNGSSSGAASFPIFVNRTTGAETALGAYKLVMCLKSPDLTVSDPNRIAGGFKLDNFVMNLSGFTTPTKPGDYRWRSLWTPYAPGTANPNTAGNVEAQSIVRIPAGAISIAARKTTQKVGNQVRRLVVLTGRLVVAGEPEAQHKLGFSHGPAKGKLVAFGSVRTNSSGNFLITTRLTKPTFFQAGATVPRQELGPAGCTASFGSSVVCVNASISGARIVSPVIRVTP
jgi:hypothetical protein